MDLNLASAILQSHFHETAEVHPIIVRGSVNDVYDGRLYLLDWGNVELTLVPTRTCEKSWR